MRDREPYVLRQGGRSGGEQPVIDFSDKNAEASTQSPQGGMMSNRLCVLAVAAALSLTTAQAQNYPTKPITIVVTAAAGGVTDVVARAIGQKLTEVWGQQIIIENRGGGAHILG